jgi:uncharacterized protein YggE
VCPAQVPQSFNGRPDVFCRWERVGYRYSNSFSALIRGVNGTNEQDTVSKVLDAATAAGGKDLTVDSLSFSASDAARQRAVRRARELALQDAFTRVTPTVELLTLELGPFVTLTPSDQVSVVEEGSGMAGDASMAAAPKAAFAREAVAAAPPTPVARGRSAVTSTVDLVLSVCN